VSNEALFCHLSSSDIAGLIRSSKYSVCYAGPGIQMEVAHAMVDVSKCIGYESLAVSLDFDERVIRMGYGDVNAVKALRNTGILINHAPGLRSALIIVDGEGYTFTPTPLYLEAESGSEVARNALRLSGEQVAEALARLSPAAKAIAIAQAREPEEKTRIAALPVEVGAVQVNEDHFKQVESGLHEAPPVKFDLARQVRVFEPYLQYVELSLTGAAIQRHRLVIPPTIHKLGGNKDIEGRLRTTFELIAKGGKLSSKPLEDSINEIRKNFTPSLGKDHGRVVLKAAKPLLAKRLEKFREELKSYQESVGTALQKHLNDSRQQIVDFYLQSTIKNPPDALIGQIASESPTELDALCWLNGELDRVFPSAESLIKVMKLEERYKDVTFETLNHRDFLSSVKKVFPNIDWEKTYDEFRAAGESDTNG